MVFNPDDEDNAHVRVVEYSRKDMDDWDGKIVFKKANPDEYGKYFSEYDDVLRNHSWKI